VSSVAREHPRRSWIDDIILHHTILCHLRWRVNRLKLSCPVGPLCNPIITKRLLN